MIIDSHGHVTAPDSLYVYKAQILAHRGAHGRGGNLANDDDVRKALNAPVFGGSSHLAQLKEVGTDLQLISPRPYQMMNSEHPRLVQWFVEETNNIIAKQVKLYPDTFRGVCGLPLTPDVEPEGDSSVSGEVRQGAGIRRLPAQPRSGRVQRHRDAAARRSLLVSAVRKAGRAGHSRPHPLGRLPLRAAAVLAALHQRREHRRRVAAELAGLQGFPDAEDPRLARRRRDPVSVRPLRSQLAARQGPAVLGSDAQAVLRHRALLEGRARAAVQDRRRRPMPVRHGAAGRRHGEGSEDGPLARRNAVHDRSDSTG